MIYLKMNHIQNVNNFTISAVNIICLTLKKGLFLTQSYLIYLRFLISLFSEPDRPQNKRVTTIVR